MSNHRNIEEGIGDAFLDGFTNGKYSMAKGLSLVIAKIFSVNMLSLMHHRFGAYFITFGTLWWNMVVMGLFFLASSGVGRTIFKVHILLVVAACIYHIIEAKRNLQSREKGKRRHSLYIGDSLLWQPFVRLVFALKKETSFLGNMTEYGFLKYIESGLCVVIGMVFMSFGLVANGFVFMMGGTAIFRLVRQGEKMERRTKQQIWDAQHESGEIEEISEPAAPTRQNRVARPATKSH